jgi:hypothetical protein
LVGIPLQSSKVAAMDYFRLHRTFRGLTIAVMTSLTAIPVYVDASHQTNQAFDVSMEYVDPMEVIFVSYARGSRECLGVLLLQANRAMDIYPGYPASRQKGSYYFYRPGAISSCTAHEAGPEVLV